MSLTLTEFCRFSQSFAKRLGLPPIADPTAFFKQIEKDTARISRVSEARHSSETLWISRSVNCLEAAKELFLLLPPAAQQEASFALLLSFPIMSALFQGAEPHSLPMTRRHLLSLPEDCGPGFENQEEMHYYCASSYIGWLKRTRDEQPELSALWDEPEVGFLALIERFLEAEAIRANLSSKTLMTSETENNRWL